MRGVRGLIRVVAPFAAVLWLMGCGGRAPETFAEVHPSIEEFSAQGPNLNFTSKIQLVTSGELGLIQIGQVATAIGEGIQAKLPGLSPDTENVLIQMHFASKDRLGNDSFVDFGTVIFPVADLQAAKFDNLGGLQVLALAREFSPGPGFDMAVNYCSDPANFAANMEFCTKVAGAVS